MGSLYLLNSYSYPYDPLIELGFSLSSLWSSSSPLQLQSAIIITEHWYLVPEAQQVDQHKRR